MSLLWAPQVVLAGKNPPVNAGDKRDFQYFSNSVEGERGWTSSRSSRKGGEPQSD